MELSRLVCQVENRVLKNVQRSDHKILNGPIVSTIGTSLSNLKAMPCIRRSTNLCQALECPDYTISSTGDST